MKNKNKNIPKQVVDALIGDGIVNWALCGDIYNEEKYVIIIDVNGIKKDTLKELFTYVYNKSTDLELSKIVDNIIEQTCFIVKDSEKYMETFDKLINFKVLKGYRFKNKESKERFKISLKNLKEDKKEEAKTLDKHLKQKREENINKLYKENNI